MKTKLTPQTLDDVWNEIKGKAHLYKTAFCGPHCVAIIGIVRPGTFNVYHPIYGEMYIDCHKLTEFCL